MKKEDYMRLPKERLAELLAERDSQPLMIIERSPQLSCFEGGPCTNPFHDCINCPRHANIGRFTIASKESNTI